MKVKAAVGDGRLSVIVPMTAEAETRKTLEAQGLAVQVVGTDSARYRDRAAALRAAFEATDGDYVFVVSASVAANVEQLPVFFGELVVKAADVVVGSKRHPDSKVAYPLRRRFLSWAYYAFVRLFIGLSVTDTQSGVMLFRRAHLAYALERMLSKTHAFDLEILAIAATHGAKIVEAPVTAGPETKFGGLKTGDSKSMVHDTLAVFYRVRVLKYYEKALIPKKLDHDPLVSIVIACPDRSWMLDECLKAIERQTYRNYEVIVLDDARTGKVRPAEKRNLGIREAKGEIVAFIDDDAYPDSHWLEYAVKYFGEPSIGAVGGPGATPPGDGRLAKIGGRVYDNVLVSGNYRYRYRAGGVRMDVEDYPSCNLFVRRDLLVKIGGYRTDFWPGEDTLLCKDIIDNWQRIIYEPWVVVYHHRRPLFAPHLRQLGRYGFHRGYFCKRYPSNSLRLSYFIPTAFVVYTVAWLALLALPWPDVMPAGLYCLMLAFQVPMGLYVLLVLATTAAPNPLVWLLTAAGVVASHLTYGVRFAQGILAKRAPCEYIGKDHGSARK